MSLTYRAVLAALGLAWKGAAVVALLAVLVGKFAGPPEPTAGPATAGLGRATAGPVRATVRDDGVAVRLSLALAAGEAGTPLHVHGPGGRRLATLFVDRYGSTDLFFGQGGPNQAVVRLDGDGAVWLSVASAAVRTDLTARPDGSQDVTVLDGCPGSSPIERPRRVRGTGDGRRPR